MPHFRIFSRAALRTLRWPLVGMMCVALVGGNYLTRGSTASADEALFDTTRLPRIPGSKELYAMPATTSFTTPGPVGQSADATRKMLAADGWQEYSPLSGASPGNLQLQVINMKKGTHGLNVFVTIAPAQNNATAVAYTAVYLATDLPFPRDAVDIDYKPDLAFLTCFTTTSIDDALAYYQAELGARGWSPWSAKDGATPVAAAGASVKTQSGAYAYYTKVDTKPLLLVLRRGDGDRTKVEIKEVPGEMLASESERARRAEAAPAIAAKAPIEAVTAQAPPARPAVEKAAATAAPAIAMAKATIGAAQATEKELEPDEQSSLPVPARHTMSGIAKTPFRSELTASVPADVAAVLGFYRRELGKRDWKEAAEEAVIKPDQVTLAFSTPTGPAVLKLDRKDGETAISLTVRDEAAAGKAGMVSKPGQARLLFGNPLPAAAVVTINQQTIKVAAGAGAKAPDGPVLDLPPGKYKYSFKVAGGPAHSEEVEVGAGETWGLLMGPGGALTLRVY
jgi:catechol 2,3-dioxygenase-like lactoylglutathione lyase family enzyme